MGVGEQLNSTHGSFELVLSPVLLALLGLWLDRSVWHTTPWCTVIFAVVGFAGAVVKLYYGYRARMAELTAERSAARTGGHR
jgi:F0F1-type ATP synthase assembly protein I